MRLNIPSCFWLGFGTRGSSGSSLGCGTSMIPLSVRFSSDGEALEPDEVEEAPSIGMVDMLRDPLITK